MHIDEIVRIGDRRVEMQSLLLLIGIDLRLRMCLLLWTLKWDVRAGHIHLLLHRRRRRCALGVYARSLRRVMVVGVVIGAATAEFVVDPRQFIG